MMKKIIFLYFALATFSIFSPSSSVASDDGLKEGYAGTDSCVDCHEEAMEAFQSSIHGNKKHPKSPAAGLGCETCHGPRATHVENEGPEDGEVPTKVATSVCLDCHNKGKSALWEGSTHDMEGLTCADCHQPHAGHDMYLAKATQPEVCGTCHKKVRSELLKNSHHPIREGKVSCSDCHNTHGTVTESLIAADSTNQKCFECHAEKRGPFLWEHAPVTEDCANCHTPHGSVHNKLLTARTPFLCQRCHSNSRHPGTLYARSLEQAASGMPVYQALNNRGFYRNCMNCHNQIHGSNHPSGKSLGR